MKKIALLGCGILAATNVLVCAENSITGPLAGYSAGHSGRELRLIYGVPGAYGFSNPLTLPEGTTRVRPAPGHDFALADREGESPLVLFLRGESVERAVPVDGGMSSPDWVTFSPNAAAAVLYSNGTRRLQVLTGLPEAPRVTREIDAATLTEAPLAAAVSDDGEVLLTASEAAVYRISREGGSQMVFTGGRIVSIAMLGNGLDAVVSERDTGSVHLLQNLTSVAKTRILASGIDGPGAVYPAADGRSIFVAQPRAKAISSVDVATGEVRTFVSGVAPAGLEPLRNRDTFLISARPRQPGWVFYRDGEGGRVVFIPAVEPAVESVR